MRRTHECLLYIIFLPAKSNSAGPTWMAAYREAFPANGRNKGFSSTAPSVVTAWRVDQASNVAALLEAMTRPFHMSSLRRFSARNCSTLTVICLPGFRKAIGAGVVRAVIGTGASGSAALDSTAG